MVEQTAAGWRPQPGTCNPWSSLRDFSSAQRATSSNKSLLSAVHHQTWMWLNQEHEVLSPSAAEQCASLLPSMPGFLFASPGMQAASQEGYRRKALKSVGGSDAGAAQCAVGLGNAEPLHTVPLAGASPPKQGCKGAPKRSRLPPGSWKEAVLLLVLVTVSLARYSP